MVKHETRLEALTFYIGYLIRAIIPPIFSLERLKKYCISHINRRSAAYSPRTALADIYKYHNRNMEAKEQYEEIIRLGQMTDMEWINLGEVLFRLEDYSGVIEVLSPIIDRFPRNRNANWYLGISFMRVEEYNQAVICLEKVIYAGSKRYEDYWNLGYCYDRIADLEKAMIAYNKALSIKPDSVELRKNIESINRKLHNL